MNGFVFLFPGQGSQYVGMGKDFYGNYPAVREIFEQASDLLGIDFKQLCFSGPESTLIQTENVQPSVTLINAACFKVLKEEGISPLASAGHSLGEYSALFASDAIDFAALMKLTGERGKFMKEAADKTPGGMIAVMGSEIEKVREVCKKAEDDNCFVEIANYNSPRQVILTGRKGDLERATELLKKEGIKLIVPLKVSGPWHSRLMLEASIKMEGILKEQGIRKPLIPVIANATGDYESEPEEIKKNLIDQIKSPVLWVNSMERFIKDGYTDFIEAGPKSVLSGLMKEINKGAKIFNVENTVSLRKLFEGMQQKT